MHSLLPSLALVFTAMSLKYHVLSSSEAPAELPTWPTIASVSNPHPPRQDVGDQWVVDAEQAPTTANRGARTTVATLDSGEWAAAQITTAK